MENGQTFTMPNQQVTQQPIADTQSPSPIKKNLISLLIGAVILISIPTTAVYLYIRHRSSSTPPVTVTQNGNPTPATKMQTTSAAQAQQPTSSKPYTDPSGFTLQLPANWEAFKRAGDSNAYQIAVHQIGSKDAPMTINIVRNTIYSVDDWINAQYGATFPRVVKAVGNNQATMIQTATGFSYFLKHNTDLYQISALSTRKDYLTVINQSLPSFSFQ